MKNSVQDQGWGHDESNPVALAVIPPENIHQGLDEQRHSNQHRPPKPKSHEVPSPTRCLEESFNSGPTPLGGEATKQMPGKINPADSAFLDFKGIYAYCPQEWAITSKTRKGKDGPMFFVYGTAQHISDRIRRKGRMEHVDVTRRVHQEGSLSLHRRFGARLLQSGDYTQNP